MPDITDPRVVKFVNERARVTGDAVVGFYETAKRFAAEFTALTQQVNIGNTGGEIADGSQTSDPKPDGRLHVTDTDLNNLNTDLTAFVTAFEAAIAGTTRIARSRKWGVNGRSSF